MSEAPDKDMLNAESTKPVDQAALPGEPSQSDVKVVDSPEETSPAEDSTSGTSATETQVQAEPEKVTEETIESNSDIAENVSDVATEDVATKDVATKDVASDVETTEAASGELAEADDDDDFDDEEEEVLEADPIEEISEVDENEEINKLWYILKVQVNRENSICDALDRRVKIGGLERYFGDILVPTEDVREFTKAGKQRVVKRKLYPGYIVVNMALNDETWFLVRETSGIGDFTGSAGKPSPLSQGEVDRILKTTKPEEVESVEPKIGIRFKIGDRVRVKEGNFENFEGEVDSIDESTGQIRIIINIFNRATPLDLDHWQVEDV